MKLVTIRKNIIKQHDKTVKRLHNIKNQEDDAFVSEQLIGEIHAYKFVINLLDKSLPTKLQDCEQ